MLSRALPRLKASTPRIVAAQRSLLHSRVPLDYPLENGVGSFLSKDALKTIAVDWQEGVLDRLNQLARGQSPFLGAWHGWHERPSQDFLPSPSPSPPAPIGRGHSQRELTTLLCQSGTESETQSVIQTLLSSASKPDEALLFNYASEALNNSFFLSTLVSRTPLGLSLRPTFAAIPLGCPRVWRWYAPSCLLTVPVQLLRSPLRPPHRLRRPTSPPPFAPHRSATSPASSPTSAHTSAVFTLPRARTSGS